MPDLVVDVMVDAPHVAVWAALTDWERQGDWMLGTSVSVASGDGRSVGSELSARTGVGRAAFVDTMRITQWDPPRACTVDHTGAVVKGAGIFEVIALPSGRSRVVWTERLELPLGAVGAAGWPIARPAARWGLRRSLVRFAEYVEAMHRADAGE